MRLTDLHPKFISSGGTGITNSLTGAPVPERKGVGLLCDCPCGCDRQLYVPFRNPISGGTSDSKGHLWDRSGDTFETLKLSPSIQRLEPKCWHGFIGKDIPGEVTTA